MPERRAYPRLTSDLPGLLEGKSAQNGRFQVPVMVNSVSCEGASIEFYLHGNVQIRWDRPVTLHLAIDGAAHQVAGVVAWSACGRGGLSRAGLRLELAATTAATRQAYAEWIIARIKELGTQLRAQDHAVRVAHRAAQRGRQQHRRLSGAARCKLRGSE